MSEKKKYSAKEAAAAVLVKAHELLKNSKLAKAETGHEKGVHTSSGFGTHGHISEAGFAHRVPGPYTTQKEATAESKKMHSDKLKELKNMPKPNLTRSEPMVKYVMSKAEIEKAESLMKDDSLDKSWDSMVHHLESKKGGGHSKGSAERIAGYINNKYVHHYKKSENIEKAENPDEKEDAELGEKVEKDVEQHMMANKAAEEKEGHKIFEKSEEYSELYSDLEKIEEMQKAEKSKHDRCVEHVKENSPEVKNPHAVCVAEGVKPAKWGKAEGTDENEIGTSFEKGETENKKAPSDDTKPQIEEKDTTGKEEVESQTAPEDNKKEQAEGNNNEWGSIPGVKGTLKLAKFIGQIESKRSNKETI